LLTNFAKSCAGVFGDNCPAYVCSKLSSFDCRDVNDMINVNKNCNDIDSYELSCVKKACDKGGAFTCDSLEEIQRITEKCRDL
jgi:hypothetical protein